MRVSGNQVDVCGWTCASEGEAVARVEGRRVFEWRDVRERVDVLVDTALA